MKIRVLLVDDEQEFVEVLAERLQARDFAACAAFDGEAALTRIEAEDFDVVVLDVLMPGKSGIETLRDMKQLKPLLEVILLTGHATVETAVEGLKLGAFDYLMKPTATKDLVEKIHQAYRRKAEQEARIRQAEVEQLALRRGWD